MKLKKVLLMSPVEMACRGRQQVLKTAERIRKNDAPQEGHEWNVMRHLDGDWGSKTYTRSQQDPAALEQARYMLRQFRAKSGFLSFAGFDESWRVKADGASRTSIIAAADAICRHEFDLLGYGVLNFVSAEPDKIDWHLDAVSGVRSPMLHWSKIDALDPIQLGDSKVIWELNRHQWLLQLGQAYRLTSNEVYARKYIELLLDWIEKNPPGYGVNWSSSLEVSLRLVSWCWALMLFRSSTAMLPTFFIQILNSIRSHAKHIERYLSLYYSPNTHLTGEALGLVYVATLFPQFKDSIRWSRLGRTVLCEQMAKQILPGGVFFEQSTRYQIYTAEIYLHFLILTERNGLSVPDWVGERVQTLLDFLLVVRRPDGSMPQIGDADGGCLLPLLRREPDDVSGLFAVAAALFEREDYAWAADSQSVEVQWLLGAAGHNTLLSLGRKPPAPSLHIFTQGGYVVMRNHWGSDAHHLIFDVGPLGCGVSSGHGHADMLSIQCSAFGENYLVDPGTGCYTGNLEWRNHFRSTGAHNSVTLDGESQACPAGPFSWKSQHPVAGMSNAVSQAGYTLIEGSHDAWSRRDEPVTHRRRVLFVKQSYWVIVDDMEGATAHDVELCFQFAPLAVADSSDGWMLATGNNGSGLLLKAFTGATTSRDVVIGAASPMRGWVSPDYGQRVAAPAVIYKIHGVLPQRMISVLFPLQVASQAPPVVRHSAEQERSVLTISDGNSSVTLTVTDADIKFDQSEAVCAE